MDGLIKILDKLLFLQLIAWGISYLFYFFGVAAAVGDCDLLKVGSSRMKSSSESALVVTELVTPASPVKVLDFFSANEVCPGGQV